MHRIKHFFNSRVTEETFSVSKQILENIAFNKCRTISRWYRSSEPVDYELDLEREEYEEISQEYLNSPKGEHRAFIVQPYVKWGDNKKRNTTPELQLEEAVALVNTLSNWTVVDKICVPLLSLDKNKLLGKGNFEKLKATFHSNKNINALFVSKNILRPVQVTELREALGVPVFDRYAIVIQIFREHAKTAEAKLQVELAEIPYVWKKINWTAEDSDGRINLVESRRKILQARETKLRNALKKLKTHRELLRKNRINNNIPIIAVVGYTNAGKTSLIKALTGDQSLEPRDQLFATLDTTAHQGILPSNLKVLYMDTIGFIQDVPETLIEPFVATFEDAIIADIIIHVFDVSHPDQQAQIEHVHKTLEALMLEKRPIINVANKCDIAEEGSIPDSVLAVSSTNSTGIDMLRHEIEKQLLAATERSAIRIRVLSGSPASAWLYKEVAVKNVMPDPKDSQYLLMDVIATPDHLRRFRRYLTK